MATTKTVYAIKNAAGKYALAQSSVQFGSVHDFSDTLAPNCLHFDTMQEAVEYCQQICTHHRLYVYPVQEKVKVLKPQSAPKKAKAVKEPKAKEPTMAELRTKAYAIDPTKERIRNFGALTRKDTFVRFLAAHEASQNNNGQQSKRRNSTGYKAVYETVRSHEQHLAAMAKATAVGYAMAIAC